MKNIEDFDNRTQLAIDEYILVLFKVFPSLNKRITKEEILGKILKNLDCDIEFNAKLSPKVVGDYDGKKKRIRISEEAPENSIKEKITIAHELTHAVTSLVFNNELFLRNKYFIEVLVSLVEKRFVLYYSGDKMKNRRVNGYISDFGDQLEIIYKEPLLEQFLAEPEHISKVFVPSDENITKSLFFEAVVQRMSLLNQMVKNVEDSATLKKECMGLEEKIMMLSDTLTLSQLNELYSSSYFPSAFLFKCKLEGIKKTLGEQEFIDNLNKYPNLRNIYNMSKMKDKQSLLDYYINMNYDSFNTKINFIVIAKLFGFDSLDGDFLTNNENLEMLLEYEEIYNNFLELLRDGEFTLDEMLDFSYRTTYQDSDVFYKNLKIGPLEGITKVINNILKFYKKHITALYSKDGNLLCLVDSDSQTFKPVLVENLSDGISPKNIEKVENIKKRLISNNISEVYCIDSEMDELDEIFPDIELTMYSKVGDNKLLGIEVGEDTIKTNLLSLNNKREVQVTNTLEELMFQNEVFNKQKS